MIRPTWNHLEKHFTISPFCFSFAILVEAGRKRTLTGWPFPLLSEMKNLFKVFSECRMELTPWRHVRERGLSGGVAAKIFNCCSTCPVNCNVSVEVKERGGRWKSVLFSQFVHFFRLSNDVSFHLALDFSHLSDKRSA